MLLSVYELLTQRVHAGESFNVDFIKRNIKVNGEYLVKNGEWDCERPLLPKNMQECDPIKMIDDLYFQYKYSIPSEKSETQRKKYFKALSVGEIPDALLFTAERREEAMAKLEGYILCSVLNGNFEWSEDMGKWFYQSKIDPDLVILRSWIENKNY